MFGTGPVTGYGCIFQRQQVGAIQVSSARPARDEGVKKREGKVHLPISSTLDPNAQVPFQSTVQSAWLELVVGQGPTQIRHRDFRAEARSTEAEIEQPCLR
jgi:hypothetical protein